MTSTEVATVDNTGNELAQYRHDARLMELKVLRKEADVRLAEEEMLLRRELQDMNEMIVDKLKNDELMESKRLPLDIEHRAEIKALEALLKLEENKRDELQKGIETLENQIMLVESDVEKRNAKLIEVKEVTAWDVDMVMAREGPSNLNEFLAKRKDMDKLQEEKNIVKELSDRLTQQCEELMETLKEQEELSEKIAAAQQIFANEKEAYDQLCSEERGLELLIKKKERQITGPRDEYKEIRQLEREKRAAHVAFLAARDNSGGNSNSVTCGENRLRQLEQKLESINLFLREHFASLPNLPTMEDLENASEVPVSYLTALCKKLEERRALLLQQDDQMALFDSSIEQMQLKINVLRGAYLSNNTSYQIYTQQQEKNVETLASRLESLKKEYEESEIQISRENQTLRRQLYR